MKISVSSYSYNKLILSGKLSVLDCILKAKEASFDAIEFAELKPVDGLSLEEYAKKLKDECDRVDLPISNFAFSADFLNGSGGDFDKEVERIKKMIDIAAILKTPIIRHDSTFGYEDERKKNKSFDDALPILIKGCKIITQYAKTKGILTTVENHGYFSQDSDRVEKLVSGVNDDNFGLLVDIGNFACVDEESTLAVGRLANYALNVHAKDFHIKPGSESDPGEGFFKSRGGNYLRGAIIGQGNVKIKQCLSILKNAGYDSYVCIEFEGVEDNFYGLKVGLNNLKKYIKELD